MPCRLSHGRIPHHEKLTSQPGQTGMPSQGGWKKNFQRFAGAILGA
jgi:hypothetical protein